MYLNLPPVIPTNPSEISEKIRSGEYFREARNVYHQQYHDVISDRYFYLGITIISLLISLLSFIALNLFFPLSTPAPFVYNINDVADDLPRLDRLGNPEEDVNFVLRRFLVNNYVKMREEYDIKTLDKNANGIKHHSTNEVFNAYQFALDPQNPLSPIARFQRKATRKIKIIKIIPLSDDNNQMEVHYEGLIEEGVAKIKERSIANITFSFKDIEVNQDTGETSPFEFVVTSYSTKPATE